MISTDKFTCVLDTNIIYPLGIRDLLFWFADADLYRPKWSQGIFSEWDRVMKRKGIPKEERLKRLERANQAFPDALVTNYEKLIDTLSLPDKKDRHVLAAAIKCNANLIVTNNLKDFPKAYLAEFGLSAKSADDFCADIIDLDPGRAVEAFKRLVANRRNPEMDEFAVLGGLKRNGLKKTANFLRAIM